MIFLAKYRIKTFDKEVKEYKTELKKFAKNKTVSLLVDFHNKKAYYSVAPLSRALHELNADVRVIFLTQKKKSENLKIVENIWNSFNDLKNGVKNKKTLALKDFIDSVNKKTKSKEFEKIFKGPDVIIETRKNSFIITSHDNKKILFRNKWFKPRMQGKLLNTCRLMVKDCYNLKRNETLALSCELIPRKKDLDLPLDDYLDNFVIGRAFGKAVLQKAKLGFSTVSPKFSKLIPMNRLSDLSTTIAGCEYSKNSKETIFKKFKKVSKQFKIHKWKNPDAVFAIIGKGRGGKHFLGTTIGYPSPNGKTRWPSPGVMFLKPWWNQQTKLDPRPPQSRVSITETLPVENFIRTCNVDYGEMRRRDAAIKSIIEKCSKLFVKGKKTRHGRTDFVIDLIPKGNKTRLIQTSDSDMRWKMDKEIFKKFKVKAGMFDNCPGGEAFFTPESISGVVIGDVVINLDQSYVLSSKNPVVYKFEKGNWKILKAPAKIKKIMKKELNESKKLIKLYKKKKSLPSKVIKDYEKNFYRVGEFAINTNPHAKLSRYLIENEKIARMIHLAMGSGFEPDRQTLYHWDTVVNSPKQKLDIFGTDKKGKEHWIIKKGAFVA